MSDLSLAFPKTQRAWTWQGSDDPRDLNLQPLTIEGLSPGSVLVRNEAIGLNPVDWKVLGGDLVDWRPGKVPGVDGAGTVVAVGPDVPGIWLKRRVAYHQSLAAPGSFAEFTPLRAAVLMRIPQDMDVLTAASLPCPMLTAWLALDKLPPRPDASLLVSGAGGAVGRYIVQLAVADGWRVEVMCNPRHWERLKALGAAACWPGPLKVGEELPKDLTGRFVAGIDSVDANHAARLAPALTANGHLVCIQGRVEAWPVPPFGQAISLHEVALGALHRHGDAASWERLTTAGEALLIRVAAGEIQPEPLVVDTFEALNTALDALRHRSFSGKPVVELSSTSA